MDTDLYATCIAEQDIVQASGEEGSPLQDGFIAPECSKMAKLALKVQEIHDAMDLVPVSRRDCVEHVAADAVGGGVDKLKKCLQVCESRYASSKYHQAWLSAFRQAIAGDC